MKRKIDSIIVGARYLREAFLAHAGDTDSFENLKEAMAHPLSQTCPLLWPLVFGARKAPRSPDSQ